jgi:glycosyltransferase involved in cell wall biosynthesis
MASINQPIAPIALVVATMSRPHAVQRLIESVRCFFPNMPIYVADQTSPTRQQQGYYEQAGCKVTWLDYDAGVSASRNAAVAMVEEPYFVLCDDDFIFTDETDFSRALAVLEAAPDIGVVGGRLFDIHQDPVSGENSRHARFWELHLHYDPAKRQLMTIPVHYFAPDPKYVDEVGYYECDAVMNFAVFRTAIFDELVRWDPRFKSNGEHEDFYLNLKVNSDNRVIYIPEIVAEHHHPPSSGYSKMRNRTKGWQLFLEKWNLRQMVDLDGVLRANGCVHKQQPYAVGYEAFYSSLPLVTDSQKRSSSTVLVSNVNGQLSSKRREDAFEGRTNRTSIYGRFRIGGTQRVAAIGGNWSRAAAARPGGPTSMRRATMSQLDAVEWILEVPNFWARPDETDRFAYLMPVLAEEHGAAPAARTLSEIDIRISLAQNGCYWVYLAPVQIYGQVLVLNQWNALIIPPAYVAGELSLEVLLLENGTILAEVSQTFSQA